ncbi:MAG TPA: bifunctional nuclease family protein [Leptolinea sp.]
MPRMIEVVIDSVRVSLTNQQRIVILREVDAERYLPIWIGPYEAEAITIALQDIEVARPQTHDLLKNILNTLNAHLIRVEVVAIKDDVFYGSLVVDVDGKILEIDSRPSDALAMAVRAHVPILASRDVLDTAGILPEQDMQSSEPAPLTSQNPDRQKPGDQESSDRLTVYEDFLQNIDLDSLNKPSEDDSEESPDDPDESKT